MRTYEFRLYPNREQRRRLDACLYESRQLYNEMMEREKQHYQETGAFLSKYDLTAGFKGRGGTYVPATTVQCLADRLTKALQNFLKYKDHDWGFPRYRSSNQWHSIHLRQWAKGKDVWLDDRMLRVPGKLGTAIKIKRHRAIEGTPKTCHLVKRADGHWYALIVCELPAASDLSHSDDDRPPIGIDVGLKETQDIASLLLPIAMGIQSRTRASFGRVRQPCAANSAGCVPGRWAVAAVASWRAAWRKPT